MTQTVIISRATEAVIPAIVAIANGVALPFLSEEQRLKGFLLPYTDVEYRDFAKRAEYFYVLALDQEPIGFVLAHSSEKIDLFGGEVYLHIKDTQTPPFIIVRQTGIAQGFAHKGYGRMLYEFLFQQVRDGIHRYPRAVCFIWKTPPNRASEQFHRAVGWKEVETYSLRNDDGVVGIWEREL